MKAVEEKTAGKIESACIRYRTRNQIYVFKKQVLNIQPHIAEKMFHTALRLHLASLNDLNVRRFVFKWGGNVDMESTICGR